MKMFKTMLFTGALALTSIVPALAQADSMRVSVPFPFMVGTQKLVAGDYNVAAESVNGIVIIQGEGRGVAVVTSPLSPGDPSGKANLVFDNTEEVPRLIRVQLEGEPARSVMNTGQAHVKFASR